MKIEELKNLPVGSSSHQFRMSSDKGYVDFSILDNEICAHTWRCPGEGRIFLRELEKYDDILGLKLTIPTVLNPKLRKILTDNRYSTKLAKYMGDKYELWEK